LDYNDLYNQLAEAHEELTEACEDALNLKSELELLMAKIEANAINRASLNENLDEFAELANYIIGSVGDAGLMLYKLQEKVKLPENVILLRDNRWII
jgi:hypothetical protein